MVRVFCDRCGRVITGMSAHERVSVTAIVVDGLMVDIHVWRVIERGLSDLGAMEKKV